MSDQKILIETRLSIQWHILDAFQQTEQIDFNNAPVIQLLDVLETQPSSKLLKSISSDGSQSNPSEISRLESKIDLLILLFTRTLHNKQNNNILNFEVGLSADTLYIKTTETLKLNQFVEVDIYFNQNCPEPMVYSGKVITSDHPDTLAIRFLNVGQLSQTYLEKYIFRLHRNEIARIKQN
ncbi:MAG: hypothetical protein ACC657_10460 [Thiohalomonadales bacterium]